MTLTTLESDHIRATLESANWRIRGAGGAAEILGLKPTTLESRMAKLGLVRPER
jgi:transcriptional regulator with GAF, ATPase, and Fis domain